MLRSLFSFLEKNDAEHFDKEDNFNHAEVGENDDRGNGSGNGGEDSGGDVDADSEEGDDGVDGDIKERDGRNRSAKRLASDDEARGAMDGDGGNGSYQGVTGAVSKQQGASISQGGEDGVNYICQQIVSVEPPMSSRRQLLAIHLLLYCSQSLPKRQRSKRLRLLGMFGQKERVEAARELAGECVSCGIEVRWGL